MLQMIKSRALIQIKVELDPKTIHYFRLHWKWLQIFLRLQIGKWHPIWGMPRRAWSDCCQCDLSNLFTLSSFLLKSQLCYILNHPIFNCQGRVLIEIREFLMGVLPATVTGLWISHDLRHPFILKGGGYIQCRGDNLLFPQGKIRKCVVLWLTGSHIEAMKTRWAQSQDPTTFPHWGETGIASWWGICQIILQRFWIHGEMEMEN